MKKFFEAAKLQLLMAYLESLNSKVCNCAACGKLLISKESREECAKVGIPRGVELPGLVEGRVHDRPFCKTCLPKRRET